MRTVGTGFIAAAACLAAAACNAIFGIEPGEGRLPAGTSGAASSTGGATSGGGGAACPAPRIPPCHPAGSAAPPCDPIALTPIAKDFTLGISVVGEHVYWASGDGKIVRFKYDGSERTEFGTGTNSVFLATDASRLAYTDLNDGAIRGATLDPEPRLYNVTAISATGGLKPNAFLGRIALRDGMLSWAAEAPNAVWAAKADGTQALAVKVADKQDNTQDTDASIGVALDDQHVYWSDHDRIRRIARDKLGDNQAIDDFATDPGAGEVAVDDARVYWTNSRGIASKKKDWSGLVTIANGDDRARALLLDGDWIYWSAKSGRILRAKRGGGADTTEVVSPGAEGAFALASDCGAIYFGTFTPGNRGTLYKVRKPD